MAKCECIKWMFSVRGAIRQRQRFPKDSYKRPPKNKSHSSWNNWRVKHSKMSLSHRFASIMIFDRLWINYSRHTEAQTHTHTVVYFERHCRRSNTIESLPMPMSRWQIEYFPYFLRSAVRSDGHTEHRERERESFSWYFFAPSSSTRDNYQGSLRVKRLFQKQINLQRTAQATAVGTEAIHSREYLKHFIFFCVDINELCAHAPPSMEPNQQRSMDKAVEKIEWRKIFSGMTFILFPCTVNVK